MPGSPEQVRDAVGFVGVRLEADTSSRSLEDPRDADRGIEAPIGLPMCGSSAFVSPGCKQPGDRGGNKLPPSYVCMKEYRGFQAPVRYGDRPCLVSHKAGKPALLLDQLRPRAIAWQARLRQSLRSTSPVNGGRTVGGLLEPSALS